ncbi:hypothetical protein LCGC14_1548850 [marine sediment metagenome]|uniref:HD/PDEase domain-containing protein n=1 Tax=marine sediment metagenome TaxID=412755 RepID=A0A0F9IQZ5_9ZZZZ
MTTLYDKALVFAEKAHTGQKRKFTGEDYIMHPLAVAWMVEGKDAKVVALLHDVLEDTDVTLNELSRGFPARIVNAVKNLTRNSGETYEGYIYCMRYHPLARRVKIADLRHNMSTLPAGHSLKKRYRAALKVLEGVEELEVSDE